MGKWTLTDHAAIILKSYGVDDYELARAVVALVLDEAAAVAESAETPIFKSDWSTAQDAAAVSTMISIAAAIRALKGGSA